MRTIRAILNRAIVEGKLDAGLYPFRKYKIQSAPTRKRAISKEAIEKIRNLELEENSTLWHVKNFFLFSFYCRGMNWIDMAYLKLASIVDGRIEYVRAKRRKSEKSFSIKINDKIQEILDWYCSGKEQSDYIFPIIQRKDDPELARMDIKNNLKLFNKHLRKIGEMCEIEGHLTSYVSRHSWGTIAKKIGVNIAVISDGYGHADPQVTQTYLDSIENEEIDEANELIIS